MHMPPPPGQPSGKLYKPKPPPSNSTLLFLSSSALFAFWLRSSVVSVLFSLISEMSHIVASSFIILIFIIYGAGSSGHVL